MSGISANELLKIIKQTVRDYMGNQNLSDAVYATWTGEGLKIDGKPIEIDADMVNVPEHLKKYKVKVSFELNESDLQSIAIIDAEDSMKGKVTFKHIKFDKVPMVIEYDKMEAGQRYLVQQKQGAQKYFIIDRIPDEEEA